MKSHSSFLKRGSIDLRKSSEGTRQIKYLGLVIEKDCEQVIDAELYGLKRANSFRAVINSSN